MFTLIIREIQDNWVFFIAAAILTCAFSLIIGWQMYYVNGNNSEALITLLTINTLFGIFIFCGLGAAQMYWDRMKKVSALLTTLPVTRNKIFAARITAGLLAVAIGYLPTVVTITVVSSMIEPSSANNSEPVYGLPAEMWIPVFLFCIASYCIGLQAGWTSNKIIPTLGALLLSMILAGLIGIKGFSSDVYLILVPFITCCLFRAWRTYSSAAL
jgi:hypothetical protein